VGVEEVVLSPGILRAFLLVTGSGLMTEMTGARSFADALLAHGPVRDQAERMGLYSPLVGDWEADVTDYDADGTRRTSKGEWHFVWVLEGRALQDVWIVPPRSVRRPGQSVVGNRYGTSLRVYDPATNVWHVTSINPVTGTTNTLLGRKQGDEIVQEGRDTDRSLVRWTFSDVTTQSFRWQGEASTDDGKTWRLAAEFFGRRVHAGTTRDP